jgi:hypothetical protein
MKFASVALGDADADVWPVDVRHRLDRGVDGHEVV